MNYEKIAEEIDSGFMNDTTTARLIERACLEAQLEVMKECHRRTKDRYHSMADSFSLLEVGEEIEAKLKAMK